MEQTLSKAMSSVVLSIPPKQIALFKAIIESYDNLATLRTEDPINHHLRLYYTPESAEEVDNLLNSLQPQFTLVRLSAD
jgi:hypothetical protein